jgi:outer membrane protein assembly factor BamE (lipoprotein component of BamABCDE complex)
MFLARLLDALALLSALLAAWLWYRASSTRQRRIGKSEALDHRDINRIIVAMNRSQILNRRAALATAASALAIALKLAQDALLAF